jgi:hypothetical protein
MSALGANQSGTRRYLPADAGHLAASQAPGSTRPFTKNSYSSRGCLLSTMGKMHKGRTTSAAALIKSPEGVFRRFLCSPWHRTPLELPCSA